MKVGIDARFYGSMGKGLGRYTSELIGHLEKIDRENDYLIFLRRENFDEYRPSNPRFVKVLAEFPWYSWQEQLIYPFWLRKYRIDLMHFPHFNVPLLYRRPFVVTIHDLILLSHPTPRATTLGPLLYRIKYAAYRLVIGRAVRDARTVITVSQSTKKEIEKVFPFAKNKAIEVTYEACGTPFRSDVKGQTSNVKSPQKPYALYVGNAYPHKNLDLLLAAFDAFRKKGFSSHSLVLVGAKDYFYDRLEREGKARGQTDNVVFFGRATDSELAEIYDSASFYVFPSLCEGFGLPPLEAMCRNIPVASSDAACMPEILGDAALYFDAKKPEAVTQALVTMATNENLRKDLVEKGRRQAAKYDWRQCAEATLRAYQRAVTSKKA